MPGATSVNGVISGLQTDQIIGKLMELERAPINRLQTQKSTLDAKMTAWQDANTRILALKTEADKLATGTAFLTKSFASSNESILHGSASADAQAGTYYVTVNSVARAEQEKSAAFADINTTSVGTGNISISIGTGAAKVISIDDSNNTLQGLRDAINRSGAGVTATIVNDGSAGTPYRLIVTSQTSGLAGAMTIDTSNLSGGQSPAFVTMQEARDASVTLGEGAEALTITRSSNEISGLIPGVTLNLDSADPAKTVTITVKSDTAAVKQAVKDFVDKYNSLVEFIDQQFKYDTTTNKGGTLFADSDLQTIQADLIGKMFNPVPGLGSSMSLLSQIGIKSGIGDNKLTIDEYELNDALTKNLDGVVALFSTRGSATSAAVSYLGSTEKTKLPGAGGYAVVITQAATQTKLTSGEAQGGNLAQDETLTINGKTIQLTQNMTADEVLTTINAQSTKTGIIASRVDGYLTLTSMQYGSAGNITATSNVASGGSGLGAAPTVVQGVNVAGTINGEAATGTGQILKGNSGNLNTEGLSLRITATAPGNYGTVSFSKGLGSIVSDYLSFITAPGTGTVKTVQESIRSEQRSLTDYMAEMEKRVAAKQDQLTAKFASMESAMAKFKSQGDYIASQIASWTGSKK